MLQQHSPSERPWSCLERCRPLKLPPEVFNEAHRLDPLRPRIIKAFYLVIMLLPGTSIPPIDRSSIIASIQAHLRSFTNLRLGVLALIATSICGVLEALKHMQASLETSGLELET